MSDYEYSPHKEPSQRRILRHARKLGAPWGMSQSSGLVITDPLEPHSVCPFRSPMAVSDEIKDIINNKVVCELGCAEGDNMVFMSRYAKKVLGFELEGRRSRATVAEGRGLSVVRGNYHKDDIPEADIYYFWPNEGCEDNEFLINKIKDKPTIVAADEGYPPEFQCLEDLIKKRNVRSIEVNFNEGDWKRANGKFLLGVFNE